MVGAWPIGVSLSASCAAAARHHFQTLYFLAHGFVEDGVGKEDQPVRAGVRAQALKTGVVRLYSVVVIFGGWVRVGCARLSSVHSF